VEILLGDVSDWLVARGGKTYGGFTIQLMRKSMDKKERKNHDQAWGLDFGDPDTIQVVYEQDQHPENLIEHPMSKNMRESLEEFLTQHPDELTKSDEFGYAMLHRETIAGNKSIVDVLLEKGAQRDTKTVKGHTAADFAKMLGWDHIDSL
jgi:ankyrin repeat protein